jgi:tRNA(Ile)-lysidine synthase
MRYLARFSMTLKKKPNKKPLFGLECERKTLQRIILVIMASPKRKKTLSKPALNPELLESDFEKEESVLIGLSGGADSVALTDMLVRLSETMNLSLTCCHINHHLRGAESEEDCLFCEELCDRWEIPFVQADIDIEAIARRQKMGLEEAGRIIRYNIFAQITAEDNIDRIALAHHADDQVETMLFRLFRGTGPAGLSGIPRQRGKIIRPLLSHTKEEIVKYLRKRRLSFREDSSNSDVRFSRNAIRQEILPAIEKHFPAVRPAMLRLCNIQTDESEHLGFQTRFMYDELVSVTPGGSSIIDLARFNQQSRWMKRRVLRWTLDEMTGIRCGVSLDTIDGLLRIASSETGGVSLKQGFRAKVERGDMYIFSTVPVSIKRRLFELDTLLELPEVNSQMRSKIIPLQEAVLTRQNKGLTVHIDPRKLEGKLYVRSARNGDRFSPLGMSGTKTVGDFLTDLKIPTPLRPEIPVLCDNNGIVWVIGYQIDDRVRIGSGIGVKAGNESVTNQSGQDALEIEIVRQKEDEEFYDDEDVS